jgi:hypothetical protein
VLIYSELALYIVLVLIYSELAVYIVLVLIYSELALYIVLVLIYSELLCSYPTRPQILRMKLKMTVFLDVTPCNLVNYSQHFGGMLLMLYLTIRRHIMGNCNDHNL